MVLKHVWSMMGNLSKTLTAHLSWNCIFFFKFHLICVLWNSSFQKAGDEFLIFLKIIQATVRATSVKTGVCVSMRKYVYDKWTIPPNATIYTPHLQQTQHSCGPKFTLLSHRSAHIPHPYQLKHFKVKVFLKGLNMNRLFSCQSSGQIILCWEEIEL